MPPIPFADNFLAGSLITLLLPIGLLIVLAVWYHFVVLHVPGDTPTSSVQLPPRETVTAEPESDVTPAGPPPGEL